MESNRQCDCYFYDGGFLIEGTSIFSCLDVEDIKDSYTAYWWIFGQMMDELLQFKESLININIYSDSRIIEELKNELEPISEFAKNARKYFLRYDKQDLNNIKFAKMSREKLINKIQMAKIEQKK